MSEDLHYDYVRLAWDIGFTFEEYDTKSTFDLSVIGLVDVDKVAKERDIPTVVKHIPTLLSFRLDNELDKVLEPNFIKIFKLSQLSIQYLKFCKKYLDNTVALLKNDLLTIREEKNDLLSCLEDLKADYDKVQHKYHELQATLSTSVYKCDECAKTFYSEEYLLAHIKRRHDSATSSQNIQTEADKLQLEIKELKQRLNNTEKLLQHEKLDKENIGCADYDEKDKVEEPHNVNKNTIAKKNEPDNDAFVSEDSIQYKFEQLKNHIEAEINSLKDEDFYRGICEKFIKERVERKLSVASVQVPSTTVLDVIFKDNKEMEEKSSTVVSQLSAKATESSTQTEYYSQAECVSEGTSMSPQPTPRRNKPHDDGDHKSIGENVLLKSKSLEGSMQSLEGKLAREVELQRETLEQILDLKLSGSLNKMEAQMAAFWDKLNAWESNLAKPAPVPVIKAISSPVIKVAEKRAPGRLKRQNSTGSIATSLSQGNTPLPSPVKVVPKPRQHLHVHVNAIKKEFNALPLSVTATVHQTPVKVVVPKAKHSPIKVVSKDGKKIVFSDSSDEEETENTIERTEDESSEIGVSEEVADKPANLKPSESFKKRLDETLLQGLKQKTQTQTEIVKPPKETSKIKVLQEATASTKKTETEEEGSTHDTESDISRYQDMKKRLKRHVEESVNQKLKDIGVSPHWKCIPDKSFKKAMEIVEHQANLSKKNIPDFHKIRKNIERAIEKEIEKSKTKAKSNQNGLENAMLKKRDLKDRNNEYVAVTVAEPTPPQSSSKPDSESEASNNVQSIEIPLTRAAAYPILRDRASSSIRRSSLSSNSGMSTFSPTKPNPHTVNTKINATDITKISTSITSASPVHGATIPTTIGTPITINSHSFITASLAPPPSKKKVIFNLDSDMDVSPAVNKKDLSAFVKQEKTKLQANEATNNKLKSGTGSDSSDWDISDIT